MCAYSRVILFAGGDTPCPPPLFCSIHPSRFVSRCLSCALFLTLSLPPSLCHTHTHTPACFVTSPAMTVSFGSERVSDMVRGKRESMNAFLVRERESARTHVRHMDPQNCEHSLTHGLSHTNVHTQIRARARAHTHTHTRHVTREGLGTCIHSAAALRLGHLAAMCVHMECIRVYLVCSRQQVMMSK